MRSRSVALRSHVDDMMIPPLTIGQIKEWMICCWLTVALADAPEIQ